MSRSTYDAIVVGARCAGAPTAMLLARADGAGLGGETDLLPALAQYQLAREARSGAVSALNHHLAELPASMADIERRLVALLQAEAAADRIASAG